MDTYSPVAPARVRCLLLPHGQITRSRFSEFIEQIRLNATIRLADVRLNDDSDRDMFSPQAFPNGRIVYELTTSATTMLHRSLVPFELYRENLVVVALADGRGQSRYPAEPGSRTVTGGQSVSEFSETISTLKETYPSAFVHQLFVFDYEAKSEQLKKDFIPIPPKSETNGLLFKNIMCDLTALLLSEMTTFAKSVQALPNLEIPKLHKVNGSAGDLFNRSGPQEDNRSQPGSRSSHTINSRAQSPNHESDKQSQRASLPAHLISSIASKLDTDVMRSQTAADGTRTPPTTFDQMYNLSEKETKITPVEGGSRSLRDRVSVHGFGSGSMGERARNQAKSRIGVVIGSMFLLAGRWPDAVKELSESATAAKANSDYAWHAKAIDYLLITLLMYSWAGLEFEIPQILLAFGDKSTSTVSKLAKPILSNSLETGQTGQTEVSLSPKAAASIQSLCALLPDLANHILHLYTRSAQFSSNVIPHIIFSDTTIRLAKLLCFMRNKNGYLTKNDLQDLVLNNAVLHPCDSVAEMKSPTKAEIVSLLYRAIPVRMEGTNYLPDRLNALAGMATVLSALGLYRKKAFVLRELLMLLLPSLIQSRKQNAAEQGIHPAASLAAVDLATDETTVGAVLNKQDGIHYGLQQFLSLVCDTYGVVLTNPSFMRNASGEDVQGIGSDGTEYTTQSGYRALNYAIRKVFGNPVLKLDVLRSCINICEAMPDLKGVLKFSSDLLHTTGSGIAPGPGTTDSSPALPVEDQIRLLRNIDRTINAAYHLGLDEIEADYWDEFLIRDVEMLTRGASYVPLARRKAELSLVSHDVDGKDGPFIYNPFAKPATALQETILIAGEEVVFAVLLQNLYDFELEIEWIRFDAAEDMLHAQTQGFVIGAYRTQHVHVLATPMKSGQLKIDACIAKVKGCRARRFQIFRNHWKMKDNVRLKRHGLAAADMPKYRPTSSSSDAMPNKRNNHLTLPLASTFEAKIIDSQPTIVLGDISLSQSSIMVLEGETKRFSINLQNISSTDADLILLSSLDSYSEMLQRTLDNHDATPAELHEVEFRLYRKPSIRILPQNKEQDIRIKAGGSFAIEVEILGRIGLNHAFLTVEYAFIGVPRSEIADRFYTRQLTIPFSITVSPTVSLVHSDFLPLHKDLKWSSDISIGPLSSYQKGGKNEIMGFRDIEIISEPEILQLQTRYCVGMLDLQNTWSDPITLSLRVRPKFFSNHQDVRDLLSLDKHREVTLQPGHISRILVLLPRLSLTDPHAPVPSLRKKRQFVISASKISPDFERLSREVFWYREEAIKHIEATWMDAFNQISGEIDLRRMLLTPRMLEVLRKDEISISVRLKEIKPSNSRLKSENASRAHSERSDPSTIDIVALTSEFYNLSIAMVSHLDRPILPLLRLQPALKGQSYNVALDLGKKLAFNGVLQRPLQALKPGQVLEVDIGVVFLATGIYEFGACIEEMKVLRLNKPRGYQDIHQGATTEELQAEELTRTARQQWFTNDACIVEVHSASMNSDERP